MRTFLVEVTGRPRVSELAGKRGLAEIEVRLAA
jgi:hypothetical protein